MRKVFIDLGAGSGDDIKGYYDLDPDNKNHEVFAFEANPQRTSGIKTRFPNATVYTAAVGSDNTTAKMYTTRSLNSSSLNSDKVGLDSAKFIDVRVIDFCEWMVDNIDPTDYITLVIDIEGSEYELLENMKQAGMWDWIDQLYVEFHGDKIENFDMSIEDELADTLIECFNDRVYIFRKYQHEQFIALNAEGAK